ncbi:hypothetical protein [Stutzerimonas stutzeri]|uniref:hypothetical protein n=1 Tax=Stutzerimonas stutzeri subgroup TaxID=578833 RepID=UPI00371727A5
MMAVNPVGDSVSPQGGEAEFDSAVQNAKQDDALVEQMTAKAVLIGAQFILMPRAQEILNEAMSDE